MADNQEEKRLDTVAISRSTVKAVTWLSSLAFVAVAGFIWDIGSQVDSVNSDHIVMDLRVGHLEDFGPKSGNRFTAAEGESLRDEIATVRRSCEKHREIKAHREQEQLNREIFWRIEKLEVLGSDATRFKFQNGDMQ